MANRKKLGTGTKSLALSFMAILAGCGGDNSSDISPDLEVAAGLVVTRTISGRVADGYIVGATVCVDLSENEACDEGEPIAISTDGGRYSLDVPDGHEDKPIVAEIPDTAIDEDTGEAFGHSLVFITPGDRPEFVSPLTTLVHNQLNQNPVLELVEAEAALKSELGLGGEGGVSLFTDYVAAGEIDEGGSQQGADRYQFLHQTARVVASMMSDVQEEVESAALDQGVDIVGDDMVRQSVQQIVRTEVHSLLEQIANEIAATNELSDSQGVSGAEAFNPAHIVDSVRPSTEIGFIDEHIDSILDHSEVAVADMETLLNEGLYWIEFNCPELPGVSARLSEVSSDEFFNCEAVYGEIGLNEDGTKIFEQTHEYNIESAEWVSVNDQVNDTSELLYGLIDGEWVSYSESDESTVEFTADGGVVVSSNSGTTTVHGGTRTLDATTVAKLLAEIGVSHRLVELSQLAGVFPGQSAVHYLVVNDKPLAFSMFHWGEAEEGGCASYNGNCNVVKVSDGASGMALTALPTDEEIMTGEVELIELFRDDTSGEPINVTLLEDGSAVWATQTGPEVSRPLPPSPEGIPPSPVVQEDFPVSDHSGPDSLWERLDVDGIAMIKITVPWILGHRLDVNDAKAILLIENDGLVRRGVFSDSQQIGSQVAYSKQAFDKLLPVIKGYIDAESAAK